MAPSDVRIDFNALPPPQLEISSDQVVIINTSASDLSLDLGTRKLANSVKWNAVVENCEFRLHDPKLAIFYKAVAKSCRFIAKRIQIELHWRNVRLIDCSFRGKYRFCQFGFQYPEFLDFPGEVRGCDFSEARLDYCIFGNTDLLSIIWPQEPHVIFFEPSRHKEEIRAIVPEWPLQGRLQETAIRDDECSAVAYSVDYLVKQKKYPEEQLQRFYGRCRVLDFVSINF